MCTMLWLKCGSAVLPCQKCVGYLPFQGEWWTGLTLDDYVQNVTLGKNALLALTKKAMLAIRKPSKPGKSPHHNEGGPHSFLVGGGLQAFMEVGLGGKCWQMGLQNCGLWLQGGFLEPSPSTLHSFKCVSLNPQKQLSLLQALDHLILRSDWTAFRGRDASQFLLKPLYCSKTKLYVGDIVDLKRL